MKKPIDYLREYVEEKGKEIIVNAVTDFLMDFINVLPILAAVAFGTYVLFSLVSKSLAKIGVFCVFFYGSIVVFLF